MKHRFALITALACAFPLQSQANLITNGGFAVNATGWTYNNQGADGGFLNGFGNPAGSFWINHNGTNVGSDPDPMLSQTIATVAGSQYKLVFDYSTYVYGGGTGLAVDINSAQVATYYIPGSGIGWLTETLLFTAIGENTTIAFRTEINSSDWDAAIDNVSVLLKEENGGGGSIPEPASLALLGLGLAGIGLTRRRRT